MMRYFLWSLFFTILTLFASQCQAGEKTDLALVLAVDCSGSVDSHEYHYQMDGIAAAFRDPAIIAAALSGPQHKIAVNILTWGDPDEQKFETGWQVISSPQSAEAFAQLATGVVRRMEGGTGIGNAVAFGLTLLRDGRIISERRVIDISGDGPESWELREPHFKLVDAQKLRARDGVTVNGLAIRSDYPNLDLYYRQYVAAGPESFVVSVDSYQDYAEGIRLKLLQELNPNLASLLLHRARY
jgi:Protein of unknown function (DUF1194)